MCFMERAFQLCVLVFKKCREQPEDVLFIDASAYFGEGEESELFAGLRM